MIILKSSLIAKDPGTNSAIVKRIRLNIGREDSMENKIKRLSEFEAKDVGGHQGFMARSLVDLPDKDVTVRLLNVNPSVPSQKFIE